MKDTVHNSIKKGRFLWMESPAKEKYVASLKKKVESGYYFSELILTKIVDELAPIISEIVPNE
ncbi:MAG: hypothetical protein GX267_15110 [Fibrobacter sp.]|jgi:hypothetical protein|nr:hypothetical protein [Fibrobacter sp.]